MVPVEHEHLRVPRGWLFDMRLWCAGITPGWLERFRLCGSPVTTVRLANARTVLPSTMLHPGYRACGVRAPFRPYPGVVCWHGFQGRALRKHALVGLLA
jgi:hypothetical protein